MLTKGNIERFNLLSGVITKYKQGGLCVDLGSNDSEQSLKKFLPNFRYIGLDIKPNADIHLDFEKDRLSFQDEEADVVVITEVIEHLANPVNILKEIKRILKPSGIMVISTPNAYNLFFRVKTFLGWPIDGEGFFNNYGHLHFCTIKQFKDFVSSEFEIVEALPVYQHYWGSNRTFKLPKIGGTVLSTNYILCCRKPK